MNNFKDIDLIEPLQRALAEEGYTTPTPIQSQTIPAAMKGQDVLGCAQTGTGKTAAFALPILDQLGQRPRKAAPNTPQVLVLAPTRELAIQIGESFETYGRHLRLRHVLVYGGVNQANQVRALNRGAHILVATPGRLIDLMDQGHVYLDELEIFVLDEADRMLDMGFMPALKRIISELPNKRQSLFFSATLPPNIRALSQRLLRNPISVDVTPATTSVERIEQQILLVERTDKLPLLRKLLQSDAVHRAIVFTKTKRGANQLAQKLVTSGLQASAIHGNKSQAARQKALEAFRNKTIQVLVATDVAARGIDIDGVTHVVNYDMPVEPESYVHRIGRTGRAGAAGIALSFCTSAERGELRAIEQLIGQRLPSERPASCGAAPSSSNGGGQRSEAPATRGPRRRSATAPTASNGNSNGNSQGNAARRRTRRPVTAAAAPATVEPRARAVETPSNGDLPTRWKPRRKTLAARATVSSS